MASLDLLQSLEPYANCARWCSGDIVAWLIDKVDELNQVRELQFNSETTMNSGRLGPLE